MKQLTYLISTILLSILLLSSCAEQNAKNAEMQDEKGAYPELPSWAHNATIYEVNTRQYTQAGTFKSLESHIPRLKNMGIDILWFMPIHPISEKNRKAKGDLLVSDIEDPEERKLYYGSPYAVADYKKVNPDYGTMEDFKSLLKVIHDQGMRLIIDWVPNHTGWDHPWISAHPEWYTQDEEGNIIDPIDYNTGKSWGWTDVADLNYDNQDMRAEMLSDMKFWLDEVGIDGFRVDVAHGIEQSFWDEMKDKFEGEDIFMLAESEVPSHRNSGAYHADYGWSFHHMLNEIAKGHKNVDSLRVWLANNRETYQQGFHMNFTSNHDENTWAGTEMDRMGDAHKAMAVLTATFEGMPLVYTGQEEPLTRRLPFFTKEAVGFKDYAYESFYKTLFDLKHNSKALGNGKYGAKAELIGNDTDVLAYKRSKDGDEVLTILNLSDTPQNWQVPSDIHGMENIFDNKNLHAHTGDLISLGPWEYIVASNK